MQNRQIDLFFIKNKRLIIKTNVYILHHSYYDLVEFACSLYVTMHLPDQRNEVKRSTWGNTLQQFTHDTKSISSFFRQPYSGSRHRYFSPYQHEISVRKQVLRWNQKLALFTRRHNQLRHAAGKYTVVNQVQHIGFSTVKRKDRLTW